MTTLLADRRATLLIERGRVRDDATSARALRLARWRSLRSLIYRLSVTVQREQDRDERYAAHDALQGARGLLRALLRGEPIRHRITT